MNKSQHQNLIREKMSLVNSSVEELFRFPGRLNAQKLLIARRDFGRQLMEYRFQFGDLPEGARPEFNDHALDPVVCGVRESELRGELGEADMLIARLRVRRDRRAYNAIIDRLVQLGIIEKADAAGAKRRVMNGGNE